jgi:uncharacterized glyoxalase superfamily metalloenzyme YdcJ
VSTAFRPIAAEELERNPFRMFTSMLVTDDRRFFSRDLQTRLDTFLSRRTLFPPELLTLADKAIADGGLAGEHTDAFLALATTAFELSSEPVDRAWYSELEAISAVAADIGGVSSTHINHLTPRVLDIDELYRRMSERGIGMIDAIQGPPKWSGPDVLLRQTSFRALAERRLFRNADATVTPGSLRVRFGEVEARGIALTAAGRDRYDDMLAEVERRLTASPDASRQDVAAAVWTERLPADELGLLREELGFFTFSRPQTSGDSSGTRHDQQDLAALVEAGELIATPIVYEDFLPRSAAGIFQSNLTAEGHKNTEVAGAHRDVGWLSDVIGRPVADPTALYAVQQKASRDAALHR